MNRKRIRQMNASLLRRLTTRPAVLWMEGRREVLAQLLELPHLAGNQLFSFCNQTVQGLLYRDVFYHIESCADTSCCPLVSQEANSGRGQELRGDLTK